MSCLTKIKSRLWRRVFIITVMPFVAVARALFLSVLGVGVYIFIAPFACLFESIKYGAVQWKRK